MSEVFIYGLPMKKPLTFASILVSSCVLTACAGHSADTFKSATKQQTTKKNQPSEYVSRLAKRAPSLGSKSLFDPSNAYYDDLADCNAGPFYLKDLMVDEIRVSNQELSTVSQSMRVMGYQVIDLQESDIAANSAQTYTCNELPIVVIQSRPEQLKVNFSGDSGDSGAYSSNGMDGSTSNTVNQLGQSNTGEMDNFLTYYHPQQREKFNKLNWLVQRKLDIPSAQVYIETLVLEVREEDSEEFGIAFQEGRGDRMLSVGALSPGENTLGWIKDTFLDPITGMQIFTPGIGKRIQVNALIDAGKAEILSRPSVLAVSNRQAVIQIVDVLQTPEVSSTLSESGNLQISSYQFAPLPIGITLNLKPRVSANRDWLTLEIDVTVESEDDENSGQVYASTESGERVLLAEKQGSSRKKVRTFARIPDRTPIIIGGLVSKSVEKKESKIPFLGNIPYLGKLFTSYDDEVQKREIIIVITPYILDENAIGIASNQPDMAITGRLNESLLFKNSYRIKNDDLFDLTPFTNNLQLKALSSQLNYLLKITPSIALIPAIQDILKEPLPGATHLVNKTLFDIVHQSDLSRHMNLADIQLKNPNFDNENGQTMLEAVDNFKNGEAVYLSVKQGMSVYAILPADNTHTADSHVLTNLQDITRLKSAIIAADIIQLNGGVQGLSLDSLHPGMELKLPKYPNGQAIKVSPIALTILNDSRHYYQILEGAIASRISDMEIFLQANQMNKY